jgi:hypothetical protein
LAPVKPETTGKRYTVYDEWRSGLTGLPALRGAWTEARRGATKGIFPRTIMKIVTTQSKDLQKELLNVLTSNRTELQMLSTIAVQMSFDAYLVIYHDDDLSSFLVLKLKEALFGATIQPNSMEFESMSTEQYAEFLLSN